MSEERESLNASDLAGATVVSTGASAAASANAPMLEELFAGRYTLLRLVGRGGMGAVYQARDTMVGDIVALKTLELGGNADALERFRREVRLARRVSHPNVARTFDLGEYGSRAFLTMEFIEGEDLQARLAREKKMTPVCAVHTVLAVCEGLSAAHAAGVVHRDLKPANIIIDRTGRVVLTDFGIARAAAEESSSRTVGTVGTPLYMAPEQIMGGPVTERTDLYAVGLLLYELLVGAPAFAGDTPMAAAFARLREAPPDPRQREPQAPEVLAELVLHCLAREPAERPASALEVATLLRDWLAQVGESDASLPPPPGSTTSSPASGRFPAVGARAPTPAVSTQSSWGSAAGSSTQSGRNTARHTATLAGVQSLAVLPLRYHGPQELDYLGSAVAESLTDLLSRTRGLQVVSSGASERFRNERDPRVAGQELGVHLLVDGTLQSNGKVLRVTARLVEVDSGVQAWSGRFEESPAEDMEAQDRLAQRIAEALRREMTLLSHRQEATPESLKLFRQALDQAYNMVRPDQVLILERLEECLALSPRFQPALALHALTAVRMSFSTQQQQPTRDWGAEARRSVERALLQAPELAESHLARAMISSHRGEWREAVVGLRAALAAAPTMATAMQYLGSLQCEAGRADEGIPRLRLAYALDSQLSLSLFEVARCSALRGHREDYQQALAQLQASPVYRVPALMLRLRVSAWHRDQEELRRVRVELRDEPLPIADAGVNYCSVVLGEMEPEAALEPLDLLLARPITPRFASLLCQFATEMMCLAGLPERAVGYLQRAASTALIDLEWLDRCPALEPLRALAAFTECRRQVRQRVEAIWNA